MIDGFHTEVPLVARMQRCALIARGRRAGGARLGRCDGPAVARSGLSRSESRGHQRLHAFLLRTEHAPSPTPSIRGWTPAHRRGGHRGGRRPPHRCQLRQLLCSRCARCPARLMRRGHVDVGPVEKSQGEAADYSSTSATASDALCCWIRGHASANVLASCSSTLPSNRRPNRTRRPPAMAASSAGV